MMVTLDQNALNAELSRFGSTMARYVDELNQDAEATVKRQVGLLMREVTDQLPPKNRSRLESVIGKDVRGVFVPRQSTMLKPAHAGKRDMVWLDAGPDHLTGVKRSQYRPKATTGEMGSMYKVRAGKMGNKYTRIGTRGKQAVQELNRIIVGKQAYSAFLRRQLAKAGKLKASFALAWDYIKPGGRRPAKWVMRHVDGETSRALGSFIDALRNKGNPSFTIISNQPGCESAAAQAAIRRAIKSRIESMKADIEKWFSKRNRA